MENYIKTTLQIKDKNIKILEECEEVYIKDVNASMSFIFCDSISHKMIDIVEDR